MFRCSGAVGIVMFGHSGAGRWLFMRWFYRLFRYYPVGAPGVASPNRTMISVFTSTNIPSRTVGL